MFEEESSPPESISVYSMATMMLDQLAMVAWSKLGLQPDMVSGKLEQDLVEAKVAIDLVAHLANIVEPQLDEDDKRRMQSLVRDLRINYVEKNKEVTT